MQSEILAHQEEQCLPEDQHEDENQEVVKIGYGTSESVGSACSGYCPHRKVKIEAADDSSKE